MTGRRTYPEATAFFAVLYPHLCDLARKKGYCLAIHGSVATDLDLLAAPWTDSAVSAGELAEAIRDAVGGIINPKNPLKCRGCTERGLDDCAHVDSNPSPRAHGRWAWAIHFSAGGSGPYIDLSIMPRRS